MTTRVHPTASELELLKLLWQHGPLSARELHDLVEGEQAWSISTTRTMLDRMRAKGLLARKSVHGMGVYTAASGKIQVLGAAIRNLARGILEVDGDVPVNAFSGSALLTDEELAEIAKLVNREDDKP